MAKNKFEDVGKVQTTDASAAMVSKVVSPSGEVLGLSFCKFVQGETYTGPAKGFMVPNEKLDEFVDLIRKARS